MALNSMLSPSEIVRRIERARLPTSKSSYNQSSAFQMAISLCLAGSGFGFFTGSSFVVTRSGVLQLAAWHSDHQAIGSGQHPSLLRASTDCSRFLRLPTTELNPRTEPPANLS